jgi:hypothetical protein
MPKKQVKPVVSKKPKFTQLREVTNGQLLQILTRGGRETAIPNGMPSTVKILGMEYQVKYHSKIYSHDKRMLRGIVIFQQRLIFLDPCQTLHMMRETLYHEMAHVYYSTWITRSPHLHKLTGAQIEDLCDMFADSTYDLVSNNKPVS